MSTLNDRLPSRSEDEGPAELLPSLRRVGVPSASATLRLVGFWTAVALPFLYLPLLVQGVSTGGERSAFVLLLGLNLLALYVGHDHNAPAG